MASDKAVIDTGSLAGAIAASIALPDEYEPVRISANFRNAPVALAKPFEELKYTWSQAQPNGLLPATDSIIFLFRNAAKHWIRYVGSSPNSFGYFWRFAKPTNPQLFPLAGPIGNYELEPQYADANPTDPYHPHGMVLASGIDQGHHYMWVDGCVALPTTVRVFLTNAPVAGPPADVGNLKLIRWANGLRQIWAILPFVAAQNGYDFAVTASGYYSVEIIHTAGNTNLASCTVSVSTIAACPVFEHHMMAGFLENAARVQRYAVIASCLLWRNTSSFENAQGDMGGVQIGSGVSWEDVAIRATTAGYSGVAGAFPNGFVSRFGAKGQYAYILPEDIEDIAFMTSSDSQNDDWANIYFPLVEDRPFLVFVASVAPTAGRETSLRICSHVQFETNDSWADVRPSDNLVDTWAEASKILNGMQQFYDNPAHIVNLLTRIGQAGKAGLNFADKALNAPIVGTALSKIPGLAAGLGLVKKVTIPTLKRGFQVVEDYGAGNFKGTDYDIVKQAIQQLDPRQLYSDYKM